MASKSQLIQELAQYDVLKDKLIATIGILNKAHGPVNNIKPTIEQHYSVDDSGNTAGVRASKLAGKISGTSNYVKNTVLPAIDQKSESIKREIRRIEEEERRAREEAERRAREEAERAAQRRASDIRFRL